MNSSLNSVLHVILHNGVILVNFILFAGTLIYSLDILEFQAVQTVIPVRRKGMFFPSFRR
jgi:hypothetical protein